MRLQSPAAYLYLLVCIYRFSIYLSIRILYIRVVEDVEYFM